MKTQLSMHEMNQLTDEELLLTYEYALFTYQGEDEQFEVSNLRYAIEQRMVKGAKSKHTLASALYSFSETHFQSKRKKKIIHLLWIVNAILWAILLFKG